MRKFLKWFALSFIAVLFIGTLWFLYQKSQPKIIEYKTKQAEIKDITKKTVATGSVVPRKEIEIKSNVSGIIKELYIKPGAKVKKGEVIAKVQVIPNMVSLNNAESRLNRAKIQQEDAETEYNRYKKLYKQKVIAEAEFRKYKISYKKAEEELEAAQNNLQLIKEGVSKKTGLKSNTLVRSTIDGMILDIPIEEGNSVIESNTFNAGTTVATVANMNEMIFKGKIDETEVGKIKKGMNLILSIGAIEDTTFKAKLEYISPKGVQQNGAIQFEIKAAVNLIDGFFIRASYSANADIILEKKEKVLAIDEGLVKFRKDSAFVEKKQKDGTFKEVYIETGLSDGINIEVKKGITKEDKLKIIINDNK